jgi:hypothetical protein
MSENTKIAGAREDNFTAGIESQTAQIPSSVYLGAALVSMAAAALFKIARKDETALFVGQWAAPFLLMGVYNKMVKQHGSDVESRKDKPNMAGSGQDDFQYARGANG